VALQTGLEVERCNLIYFKTGSEYLHMTKPRAHQMALLGLGNSVGTNNQALTGEVFVVKSFDDLAANATKAKGKIVLFNAPFVTYGQTVAYRVGGASAAAKVGAVAALVRSITPFSLYTPHTGVMRYDENVAKIPTAAITIEDAEMMQRMQDRGQTIEVELFMVIVNIYLSTSNRAQLLLTP
jgi:carboxypeptidase Q